MRYEFRQHLQSKVDEFSTRVLANDTGVGTNLDLIGGLGNGSAQDDNLLGSTSNGSSELRVCRDSCTFMSEIAHTIGL